jgi:hypothetical protein
MTSVVREFGIKFPAAMIHRKLSPFVRAVSFYCCSIFVVRISHQLCMIVIVIMLVLLVVFVNPDLC